MLTQAITHGGCTNSVRVTVKVNCGWKDLHTKERKLCRQHSRHGAVPADLQPRPSTIPVHKLAKSNNHQKWKKMRATTESRKIYNIQNIQTDQKENKQKQNYNSKKHQIWFLLTTCATDTTDFKTIWPTTKNKTKEHTRKAKMRNSSEQIEKPYSRGCPELPTLQKTIMLTGICIN